MTVLICGSPASGFEIIGLFANSADAQSYAEDYSLKDWWVAEVISPGAFAESQVATASRPHLCASEQMADRVEPCNDADVKSAPIERHHEHEKNHYGPHFRILSPTPSAAPLKPAKLAAKCLTLSGQGCSCQQQRHRSDTG